MKTLLELTDAELQDIAAGREADALVAVHLFGWRWWEHKERGLCGLFPGDEGMAQGWRRANFHDPDWVLVERPGELFGDWDACGILTNERLRTYKGLPHYSTDIADSKSVRDRVGEKGFHCQLKSPFVPGEPYHVGFTAHGVTGWNGRPDFRGWADTEELAVVRAALIWAHGQLESK